MIFHYCKIDKYEINYRMYNKEILAIISAFKQWRRYIERPDQMLIVKPNHKNFITLRLL
jgi:hypothetical protein